nr:MAG TPA: hypothetical protein [Caudoviricetes sp.]
MKNLKYVAKIEQSIDILQDGINDFIVNNLEQNEYIIDIKMVKVGETEYPGDYSNFNCKNKDYDMVAYLFIGEK